MGVTVNQINEKYMAQDKNWNLDLFPSWLERKGIPNTKELPIVATTLEQILIEFTPETLPEKHHDFDNIILARAQKNKNAINRIMIKALSDSVQESLKRYDYDWNKLNKFQKIWKVIVGEA